MHQKHFLDLASLSFIKKLVRDYFSTFFIIKGFFIATALSSFIYLSYFNLSLPFFETVFAIVGFWLLIGSNKMEAFWSGFFISLLWFWWIGLSFRYYDTLYLYPFLLLALGLIYGILFSFIGYFKHPFLKVLIILALSYIYPFGFNWLKLELSFINSYLSPTLINYILFLSLLAFLKMTKEKKIFFLHSLFALLALIFFHFQPNKPKNELHKIYIQNPFIPQDKKWDKRYRQAIIENNFLDIDKAISNGYDIALESESAFPIYLQEDNITLQRVLEKLQNCNNCRGIKL